MGEISSRDIFHFANKKGKVVVWELGVKYHLWGYMKDRIQHSKTKVIPTVYVQIWMKNQKHCDYSGLTRAYCFCIWRNIEPSTVETISCYFGGEFNVQRGSWDIYEADSAEREEKKKVFQTESNTFILFITFTVHWLMLSHQSPCQLHAEGTQYKSCTKLDRTYILHLVGLCKWIQKQDAVLVLL